jgi:hypothetical protein
VSGESGEAIEDELKCRISLHLHFEQPSQTEKALLPAGIPYHLLEEFLS